MDAGGPSVGERDAFSAFAAQLPESLWLGVRFEVRVEYHGGSGKASTCGVGAVDVGCYQRSATGLAAAISAHFDGQLSATIVEVSTPYALEVIVVPAAVAVGPGSDGVGGAAVPEEALIFSKVEARAWPQTEAVLAQLRTFCQLPFRLTLLRPEEDDEVRARGVQVAAPLSLIHLRLWHASSGAGTDVQTNSAGEAEVMLFPGRFFLGIASSRVSGVSGGDSAPCATHSLEDLTPDGFLVSPLFGQQAAVLLAEPRRRCTLWLRDSRGRPLPSLPMLLGRGPGATAAEELWLKTDADGLCECLLPDGDYRICGGHAIGGSGAEPEAEAAVMPFAHDLRVAGSGIEMSWVLKCRRVSVSVTLTSPSGEPIAGCPITILQAGEEVWSGHTTVQGLAVAALLAGEYQIRFQPLGHHEKSDDHPASATACLNEVLSPLVVSEEGTWSPDVFTIADKFADVTIIFVTPDGEAATHCRCTLRKTSAADDTGISLDSGDVGCVTATLQLLAAHVLEIRNDGQGSGEYEPQDLPFVASGRSIRMVVRPTLLGCIAEDRFAILVDASQPQVRKNLLRVEAGVRDALQQRLTSASKNFGGASRVSFGMLSYTSEVGHCRFGRALAAFRPSSKSFRISQRSSPSPRGTPEPRASSLPPGVALGAAGAAPRSLSRASFRSNPPESPAVFGGEGLAALTRDNIVEAAAYCGSLPGGSGEDVGIALEAAFKVPDIQAVCFVVDGRSKFSQDFLRRIKLAYYSHDSRPRLRVALVNGSPNTDAWRQLKVLSLITRGFFRSISWTTPGLMTEAARDEFD